MSTSTSSDRLLDRTFFLAATIYLILTIAITWPVAATLGRTIAGEGVDIYSHLWTFQWVRDALFSGQDPFFTTRIFYPTGVSLANHNIAWLHILLWIPLQALFGTTAGYNLLFLAIITANGLTMFLLARELLDNTTAAFFSGLIVAFWPYILTQNEHPNLMFITWVPLALLFLRRALQGPTALRRRNALLAALFIALTGWVRWQLLILVTIPMALYVLALLWPQTWTQRRQSAGLLLGIGTLTAVSLLPIALPVARYQLTRDNPADLFIDEHDEKQTDLLAYITPTEIHPLWENTLSPIYGRFHDNFNVQNQTRRPYLGYTVVLLALIGTAVYRTRSRLWAIMALLLLLYALGPLLRINGVAYPQIPMPYELIANNPLLRLVRLTDRMNVLLSIPIAMLAGFGLLALFRIVRRRPQQLFATALLSLFILGEYAAFPFPQSSTAVPDWLVLRQTDADDYALLHLPNHLFGDNKFYMFYQTVHDKPIVNGKVARVPREALAFWKSIPLLNQMQDEFAVHITRPDVGRQLQLLNDANIRYVVIHKNLSQGGQLVAWRDWFTINPLHDDDELLVYTTTPQHGRDYTFAQNFTGSIGLIRHAISPDTAVAGGTLKANLRLGTMAAPQQLLNACFYLINAAGDPVRTDCQPITPSWPTSDWPADTVAQSAHILSIDTTIPPGSYTLRVQLADEGNILLGAPTDLGPVTIVTYTPTATADIVWQDQIALPDYRLKQTADALNLTLYWQALSDIDNQYKFFIHVTDPATGDIVVQVDAAPRNWTYPTFAWEPGERIHDDVTLPLADLAPGSYHVNIGWYNEETGDRLTATAPESNAALTAVPLTTITIP